MTTISLKDRPRLILAYSSTVIDVRVTVYLSVDTLWLNPSELLDCIVKEKLAPSGRTISPVGDALETVQELGTVVSSITVRVRESLTVVPTLQSEAV